MSRPRADKLALRSAGVIQRTSTEAELVSRTCGEGVVRSIEAHAGIAEAQLETTRACPDDTARRGFNGSFEQCGEAEA